MRTRVRTRALSRSLRAPTTRAWCGWTARARRTPLPRARPRRCTAAARRPPAGATSPRWWRCERARRVLARVRLGVWAGVPACVCVRVCAIVEGSESKCTCVHVCACALSTGPRLWLTCAQTHAHAHTCTHAHTRTRTRTYTHTRTHARTRTHIQHTHTPTHAHTRLCAARSDGRPVRRALPHAGGAGLGGAGGRPRGGRTEAAGARARGARRRGGARRG